MGAVHESGFRVEVEGNPRNPNAVHPGKFPVGLDAISQVRLLRMGVEAIAAAAKSGGEEAYANKSPRVIKAPKPSPFGDPAKRPKRATLSLKRKSEGHKTTD